MVDLAETEDVEVVVEVVKREGERERDVVRFRGSLLDV